MTQKKKHTQSHCEHSVAIARLSNRSAFTLAEGATHVDTWDNIRKSAFTLAEVLITLAIIGIVAAMTIPTLLANYQEKQVVTSLRKFQTTFNQAYLQIASKEGFAKEWGLENVTNSYERCTVMFEKFRPYLKLTKDCGNSTGCFATDGYKKINGENADNWDQQTTTYKIILSDGMSVQFHARSKELITNYGNTTQHGTFVVDINGPKGPNIMGQDTFTFFLTNNSIVPFGNPTSRFQFKVKDSDGNYITDENGDYIMSTDPLNDCNRTQCVGYCEACAAWVIENGNMDYLHCDDLSWSGKRQCSD